MPTMTNFTKGLRGPQHLDAAMRVYDRLRKRSYRLNLRRYGKTGTYHSAYVRGVKDAIAEMVEEQ